MSDILNFVAMNLKQIFGIMFMSFGIPLLAGIPAWFLTKDKWAIKICVGLSLFMGIVVTLLTTIIMWSITG